MRLNPKDKYNCMCCEESFRLRYNLLEHYRQKHKHEYINNPIKLLEFLNDSKKTK